MRATTARAVTISVLIGTFAGCESDAESASGHQAVPQSGWTRIAEGPLSPRQGEMVVWTGREMLVIGGYDGPPCPPNADCVVGDLPLTDGAAYDPVNNNWRSLADLPTLPEGVRAFWQDGTVVLLLDRVARGEQKSESERTWVYDLENDTWQLRRVTAEPRPSPGRLDPHSAIASTLPPGPKWGPTFDRTIVWTGNEFFLTALITDDSESPKHYRLARFRPGDKAWIDLGRTPVEFWNPVWYWFQGRLTNPSQNVAMGASGQAISGTWDPASNRWEPVAQLPPNAQSDDRCPLPEIGVAGDWLVTYDGILVSVSPSRVLAAPKCDAVAAIHSAVWTGSEILTWGAIDRGWRRNLSVGYRWQPPQP